MKIPSTITCVSLPDANAMILVTLEPEQVNAQAGEIQTLGAFEFQGWADHQHPGKTVVEGLGSVAEGDKFTVTVEAVTK